MCGQVSKVDPEDVKSEEKRQTAGQIEDEEIVQAVNDYVEVKFISDAALSLACSAYYLQDH